ncbi:MAG: hypothetical protein LBC70_08155 [Chitinispirillales bacterium]|jgi:hypothetical protein|nr:hypothetical protein [Chitinispirillales bacterium]
MVKAKEILPTLIIALFGVLLAYGQAAAPLWIDEAWRGANYPLDEWYVGFSADMLRRNDKPAESLERLEHDAKSKMVESITVRVSSQSTLETASHQTQRGQTFDETIDRKYKQSIEISVSAEISGAEVRSYHDPRANRIYAFAAVNKKRLANYYRSQINLLFAFADRELTVAERASGQERHNFAPSRIRAVEDSLNRVGYWNSILQAVESDGSFAEREKAFAIRLSNVKSRLPEGTAIFLDISGDNTLDALGAEIRKRDGNFVITEERDGAVYLISIMTRLNRCTQNNFGQVFCDANAIVNVSSQNSRNAISVRIPEATGIWTDGDKDKATEEAFKELMSNIAEKVVEAINRL